MGAKDECILFRYMKPQGDALVKSKQNEVKYYPDGGHWIMNTHADEVNKDIIEWFNK